MGNFISTNVFQWGLPFFPSILKHFPLFLHLVVDREISDAGLLHYLDDFLSLAKQIPHFV